MTRGTPFVKGPCAFDARRVVTFKCSSGLRDKVYKK